ncbi:MAG TPA: DUF5684 domain-containing protein [Candidatus Cryosericum sp.]|nr:DUF5684 domain-containing protein [Candidatus Cryosericum sp.]
MEYYYDRLFPWYGTGGSFVGLAIAVLAIIGMWKIFEKAGEPGWAAIIPFYNAYVLFKITWGSGWMFLLLLIPIANIVIYIITMVKLARAFNRSGGFAVGLIFLSVIFYCILGFDTSAYVGVPQSV